MSRLDVDSKCVSAEHRPQSRAVAEGHSMPTIPLSQETIHNEGSLLMHGSLAVNSQPFQAALVATGQVVGREAKAKKAPIRQGQSRR